MNGNPPLVFYGARRNLEVLRPAGDELVLVLVVRDEDDGRRGHVAVRAHLKMAGNLNLLVHFIGLKLKMTCMTFIARPN